MSAAHTCIRSALTQAFRPSNTRLAAACTVPVFLVPALTRPPQRHFSTGKRRPKEIVSHTQEPLEHSHGPVTESASQNVTKQPPNRITLPKPGASSSIQSWLAVLDPYLPPHLRQNPSSDFNDTSSATPEELSWIVNKAQDASQDIFSHMGLVERRWDAVLWLVKRLVEGGGHKVGPPVAPDPFANILWPESSSRSLDELTNQAILIRRAHSSKRFDQTLEELTATPQSNQWRNAAVKRALGQLWRSLGNMILVATKENNQIEQAIMPHVLEIIAYLHHIGLIPYSVYTDKPPQNEYALQQPPTLHLLSSNILAALSDATWRAHEEIVKSTRGKKNRSYFLGRKIPESRYRVEVAEVAPELWLELVLWSCLHGGWTLDGTAVLEQMASSETEHKWGLLCWREAIQSAERDAPASPKGWGLFRKREDTLANAQDRAMTRRTISSEVVTAFIDGLVSKMRVGVGVRGTSPEELIDHIKKLRGFLDAHDLSLGSASWDSIMARLLESGGIVPEKRPELLLSMLGLAAGFGTEVNAINASPQKTSKTADAPYFFEPTTIPLGFLHRSLRSFIEIGDISGAMETLRSLQQYTDNNKQRSLQQFFDSLKRTRIENSEPFTSRIPPINFPAFDNQLPVPLLAKLLDLCTDSKQYDLGRWLLFSTDLDGPMISPELYEDWNIAASVIRFGTLAKEDDLVLEVVKRTGVWSQQHRQQSMPPEIFTALFCSQVKGHRWDSVQGMQNYMSQIRTFQPSPVLISTFAAELLRLSRPSDENGHSALLNAQKAFADLLFAWESVLLRSLRNELNCMLGIMSSTNKHWRDYCSQFLTVSSRQEMQLPTEDFNQILSGVLDGYGSLIGKELVQRFCHSRPATFTSYRAAGGVPTMPRYREGQEAKARKKPQNIEVVQESGARLTLQGRIHPNRQTILAVLRKAKEEAENQGPLTRSGSSSGKWTGQMRQTLRWASVRLSYLGLDREDILRELGSLAITLADPEAPLSSPGVGGASRQAE